MNKTKKEIEEILKKIAPLNKRISELEEQEILEFQRPRLLSMVGFCLRSIYEPKTHYGRILDLVKSKSGLWFILEECHITKEGNPYLHLDSISPYLNKEWWDAEVPISGWKRCLEEEYFQFKANVTAELNSQRLLRNWIAKQKY